MKLIGLNEWKRGMKAEGKAPQAGVAMTPMIEAPRVVEVGAKRANVDEVRAMLVGIGADDETVERAMDTVAEADVVATYTMSTDTIDRPGDKIHQEGWMLDEYRANPVMLFAHDASQPSVGMSLGTFVQRGALRGTFRFTPESVYAFGATVGRLVKHGFMRAGSVGFAPVDVEVAKDRVDPNNPMHDWFPPLDFKAQKLLEFSAVPIPANPDALVDARGLPSGDVRAVREWAERCLAGEGGKALSLPREVVERMASLGKPVTLTIAVTRSDDGDLSVTTTPTAAKAEDEGEPAVEVEVEADALTCPECGYTGAPTDFVPAPAETPQEPQAPSEEVEEGVALPKAFDGWQAVMGDPDALRSFVNQVTKDAVAKAMREITGRLPD